MSQKNKQHDFLTFFIPGPKDKMATNGKINTNPSGSSLGEQLVAKRLTLIHYLVRETKVLGFFHNKCSKPKLPLICDIMNIISIIK